MELHIDSSTLIKVVKEDRLPELLRAAGGPRATIHVASPVIDELLAGEDEGYLRCAAQVLVQLLDSGRFRISAGLHEVLAQELQRPLMETPVATKEFRRRYRRGLEKLVEASNPVALLGELRHRAAATKADWEPEDSRLEEAIKEEFLKAGTRARDVGMELEALSPATVPEWLLGFVVHRLCERTDVNLTIIRQHPDRYPCVLAWAGLLFLWIAAFGVPADHRNQHRLLAFLKQHRNDFLDVQIAAEAAYGAVFVTEDATLRQRCEALRERQCLRFRSLNFETYLQG